MRRAKAPPTTRALGSWRGAVRRWLAERWGLVGAEPFLSSLRGLARSAEVMLPRELIPLFAEQSARALLAAQVFQAGPHWVWPYWVERQLDPKDPAYLPRAMSPLWHNLTHRNWTAIGVLDEEREGVVDPRGLLMAQRGGWSLDVGVFVGERAVFPSRLREGYEQTMARDMPLVFGRFRAGPVDVTERAWAERMAGAQLARLTVHARARERVPEGWLAISLRPYNPEGPAVVRSLAASEHGFLVDGAEAVVLQAGAARTTLSTFFEGDALFARERDERSVVCDAGQASAAAFWRLALDDGEELVVRAAAFIDPAEATRERAEAVRARLCADDASEGPSAEQRRRWRARRDEGARLELPDDDVMRLFEQAHTTLLVLDDVGSIKPGPLTYHQHWFRDSAYLVGALARLGHRASARAKLTGYAARQDRDGFFRSQEGEWDSNGQAIWTLVEHDRLFGDVELLRASWPAIAKGARWIVEKRHAGRRPRGAEGLLPAGLSAEHLGPHDCYFWDDLWGVAGLFAAAHAAKRLHHDDESARLVDEGERFLSDVERALSFAEEKTGRRAMPAAPQRGFDAGMIGNVAAVYPLELFDARDERVVDTLRVLEERFFVDDAFLQAMVHSGYNPYLTLHCAQVYLRQRDGANAWRLFRRVAALATSTGTWPEAIHPLTLGGCMGDGCHGWAAAELILFLLGALVVEERDRLVVTPIFDESWRRGVAAMRLPTRFGALTLHIDGDAAGALSLRMELDERVRPRAIAWCLPAAARDVVVDGRVRTDLVGERELELPAQARRVDVRM